jgi:hypothetical protein
MSAENVGNSDSMEITDGAVEKSSSSPERLPSLVAAEKDISPEETHPKHK